MAVRTVAGRSQAAAPVRRGPRAAAAAVAAHRARRGRRLRHRGRLPAALPRDADHGGAPAARALRRELPAAPLRLVQPHQHVGRRVRHHVRRAGEPGDRGRRHPARAAGGPARRLLHVPAPVPRPRRLPAPRAGHADAPADRADRGHLQGVPRLRAARRQPRLVTHPGQRRIQSRVRGLDPERLHLLDPGRARAGRDGGRQQPPGRAVPDHAAAGDAGRGDRADLHLHRGVERVHLGSHPHHQQRRLPAHGAPGLVHRPVHGGLAAPVRRLGRGHHPGVHPVRPHRGPGGGRPDGRLESSSRSAVALAHRVVQIRPSSSTA